MTYGTIKVDTVTFTNAGVDKSVTLSGLVQNPIFSGNVTVTGTLSGVTVTGTTANFTSGNFTNISGGTHTITSGVFAAGSAASPSITFTGDLNTGIYSPGADQVAISTGGSGRLFVDASGNVGVATGTPSYRLEVNGTISQSSQGTSSALIQAVNAGGIFYHGLDNSAGTTFGHAYAAALWHSGAYPILFATNGSERLRITSAGLVGVGTSSPSNAFQIESDANSDQGVWVRNSNTGSSASSNVYVNSAAGQLLFRAHSAAHSVWPATALISSSSGLTGGLAFNTGAAAPLAFLINNSERLRITSTGQLSHIGAGSSGSPAVNFSGSAPSNSLVIDSSGNVGINTAAGGASGFGTFFKIKTTSSSPGFFLENGAADSWWGVYGGTSAADSAAIVYPSTGSIRIATSTSVGVGGFSEKIRITSAGLVGIGTSSPGALLDVSGAGNIVRLGDGTNTFDVRFKGPNNWAVQLDTSTDVFNIQRNSTPFVNIDGAGRVGIGTASLNAKLVVSTNNENFEFSPASTTFNGGVLEYLNRNTNTTRPDLNYYLGSTTGGSHKFWTDGTERARIDSSGRLLVGTSSARQNLFNTTYSALLQVESQTTGNAQASFTSSTAGINGANLILCHQRSGSSGGNTIVQAEDQVGIVSFQGADGTEMVPAASVEVYVDGTPGANDMPGRLVFSTTADGASSPTERMRIQQSGAITFGSSTNTSPALNGAAGIVIDTTPNYVGLCRDGDTALGVGRLTNDGSCVRFYRSGTDVGNISVTTTATTYNSGSDYRLKENVTPLAGGIARLKQLKPSQFNFIVEPHIVVDGFIAHEVQEIVPQAVTGEKDDMDDDGNPIYQGIDQSKLVPLLTAALQEAVAKIESLEARLTVAGI